jgi:hypothetical protein
MKRRPPSGNVRRVRHINGNTPSTYVNKANRTVQCESFQEYKLAVWLDFDPSVEDFLSQPTTFEYRNSKGKKATYVPDYVVWRTDESVEIHEVTVEKRRQKKQSLQKREAAATQICKERGWKYIVHTDETLPSGSEWANLDNLVAYRPRAYANDAIEIAIIRYLTTNGKTKLARIIADIAVRFNAAKGRICSTLLHLIWHHKVQASMDVLLYIESSPNDAATVWIGDTND